MPELNTFGSRPEGAIIRAGLRATEKVRLRNLHGHNDIHANHVCVWPDEQAGCDRDERRRRQRG